MRPKNAADFFSEAERERIAEAVSAVEAGTSGEIATMVVERSDSYREAENLGAVLAAGFAALVVEVILELWAITYAVSEWNGAGHPRMEIILHGVSIWSFIPLVVLFFFPARLLFRRLPLLGLPLVGKKRVEEAVRERAVRAFYEKGLYRTRDETGVLIFISILERKVWILGDRGINREIPREQWLVLARELSDGIRQGNACDALCAVIAKVGAELARLFPRGADDVNELTDRPLH